MRSGATSLRRIGGQLKTAISVMRAGATPVGVARFLRGRAARLPQATLNLGHGISLTSPPEEELLAIIDDVWVKRRYLRKDWSVNNGDTIIDVGAHIGAFTVWASRAAAGGRVIAAEGSPRMCRFLRANIEANGLKNVSVFEGVVRESSGEAVLYSRGLEWGNTLYPRDMYQSSFAELAKTEALSLPDLFTRFEVDVCHLLKLNCEGAEYEVLFESPASILNRTARIAVQYHIGMTRYGPADLDRFLRGAGFEVDCRPLQSPESGYLYAWRADQAMLPGSTNDEKGSWPR